MTNREDQGRKAEKKSSVQKPVDYKAFGKALNNLMNEKGISAETLARRADFGTECFYPEREVGKAQDGYITSTEIVEAIVAALKGEGFELAIPYREKGVGTAGSSPFGRGRPKGSKNGSSWSRGGSEE